MTPHDHPLARLGLAANAVFSLASGLLLTIAPDTVGGWLGVNIDGWLRLLGIALLAHAGLLALALRQPQIERWTRLNLAAIAPYPFLMIAVVGAGLVDKGQALVLADGAIVGAIALTQWFGLRTIDEVTRPLPA